MDRSQLGRLQYEHLIVTLTLVAEVEDGHMHHCNGQVDKTYKYWQNVKMT